MKDKKGKSKTKTESFQSSHNFRRGKPGRAAVSAGGGPPPQAPPHREHHNLDSLRSSRSKWNEAPTGIGRGKEERRGESTVITHE